MLDVHCSVSRCSCSDGAGDGDGDNDGKNNTNNDDENVGNVSYNDKVEGAQ